MYAVIATGGKQYRVAVGDTLDVEKLTPADDGTVALAPLLLVDGDTVTSAKDALADASVTAEVVEQRKGPKIVVLQYRNKTRYRRKTGHRQRLTRLKITDITA